MSLMSPMSSVPLLGHHFQLQFFWVKEEQSVSVLWGGEYSTLSPFCLCQRKEGAGQRLVQFKIQILSPSHVPNNEPQMHGSAQCLFIKMPGHMLITRDSRKNQMEYMCHRPHGLVRGADL